MKKERVIEVLEHLKKTYTNALAKSATTSIGAGLLKTINEAAGIKYEDMIDALQIAIDTIKNSDGQVQYKMQVNTAMNTAVKIATSNRIFEKQLAEALAKGDNKTVSDIYKMKTVADIHNLPYLELTTIISELAALNQAETNQ